MINKIDFSKIDFADLEKRLLEVEKIDYKDIYRQMASEILGKPYNEITPEERISIKHRYWSALYGVRINKNEPNNKK